METGVWYGASLLSAETTLETPVQSTVGICVAALTTKINNHLYLGLIPLKSLNLAWLDR